MSDNTEELRKELCDEKHKRVDENVCSVVSRVKAIEDERRQEAIAKVSDDKARRWNNLTLAIATTLTVLSLVLNYLSLRQEKQTWKAEHSESSDRPDSLSRR